MNMLLIRRTSGFLNKVKFAICGYKNNASAITKRKISGSLIKNCALQFEHFQTNFAKYNEILPQNEQPTANCTQYKTE